MESKQLRKRLRSLGTVANSRFPFLNYGGCCVFAAAVAGELERLGVEHEVIVPGTTNVGEVRPLLKKNTVSEWNSVGVEFGHVGVRLKLNGKWHTYDSDGLVKAKKLFGHAKSNRPYKAAPGGLTADEAKELANDAAPWNKSFERCDVPRVRRMVREMMRAPM